VPLDIILQIGKIIQYDFNAELKEISQIPLEYKLEQLSEPDITFENTVYWKSKYFELLQQHQLLLKDKLEDYYKNSNNL